MRRLDFWFVCFCLMALLAFSNSQVALAESDATVSSDQPYVTTAVTSDESAFICVPAIKQIGFSDLKSTQFIVFAASQTQDKYVLLKSIKVIDPGSARIIGSIDSNSELNDVSSDLGAKATPDLLSKKLIDFNDDKIKNFIKKAYANGAVNVDLEGQNLKDGETRAYKVEAVFEIQDKKSRGKDKADTPSISQPLIDSTATSNTTDTSTTINNTADTSATVVSPSEPVTSTSNMETVVATVTLAVASLPSRAGWHCGDGHFHSNWSDGGAANTITQRSYQARDAGYHWIIPTDHENKMTQNGGWDAYIADCNLAQIDSGILVAPGAEITSASPYGDCLGYWMRQNYAIPRNQTYSAQNLITNINNQNPGYSWAVIAHPYGSPSWPNWNATGFKSMELISNNYYIDNNAYSKWRYLLNQNLASTINGNGFIVALGGSDTHVVSLPGPGCTWIYDPNFSYSNRAITWQAIKAGKASASGAGSLGAISLNNAVQGSVIVNTGSSIPVKIVQQPRTSSYCTGVSLRNKNGSVLLSYSNPPAEINTYISAPANDDFYFAVFDFSFGAIRENVITNPIFVDRR